MKQAIVVTAIASAIGLVPGAALADVGHDTATGKPGDPRDAVRTIEITASDTMRYSPSRIEVARGETVRLVVRNTGKIDHEIVLGSLKDLKSHAELMRKHPGMEHAEPNMAHVRPGETGEIVWRFTHGGTVDFACTIPGHLEAGMTGKFVVTSAKR